MLEKEAGFYMKQLLARVLLLLFFLVLMLNPQITVSGATTGLLLWFHSVIPSLLPFMILSNLLVSLNGIALFTTVLTPLTSRLFGISQDGSYALLAGFICGYPMGAKTCADLLLEKKISREEAQYLLCFVNNPGPAFISGYLLQKVLKGSFPASPFFLAIYGAPFLMAVFLRSLFPHTKKEGQRLPFLPFLPARGADFRILDHAIMNGFETATKLGGYIIMFSILSAFLSSQKLLCLPLKAFLLSITEITTGVEFLGTLSGEYRNMAVCACVSFGGLSGLFQTKSVISDTSLKLLPYILSKIGISLLSAILYGICSILTEA